VWRVCAVMRSSRSKPGRSGEWADRPTYCYYPWMDETRTVTCDACSRPLVRIDAWGERLDGCIVCNAWTEPGGERLWRKLPDEDVEALRAMMRPRIHSSPGRATNGAGGSRKVSSRETMFSQYQVP
jgi:hypothetical protein